MFNMKIIKFIPFFLILGGLIFSPNLMSAKIEVDTDLDGLTDYEEINVYKSDKTKKDTDGDGYRDGEEVYHGYSPKEINGSLLKSVSLVVPYILEAPDGNWTGPWKNACEEATISMVEYYYLGDRSVTKTQAKDFMWSLFTRQNQIYGSNADADSVRTAYLINNFGSFWAKRVNNPTINQIKKELQKKRPVITFHHGFDLKNKNIPFLASGSSYHVMVLVGYDDDKKQFIVNDPGDTKEGQNHRYDYDLFMNTLHDFDHNTGKADGKPVIIFTYPRLVKIIGNDTIYYLNIEKNSYHIVTSPEVFIEKNLNWNMVMSVESEWLNGFTKGDSYTTKTEMATKGGDKGVVSTKDTSRYIFTKYLYIGSSGEEVKQLQLKLKELGYFTYPTATGFFGNITVEAVIKFQKANIATIGSAPGWVGPGTRRELNN